ncbi:hypothetical protein SNOG_00103 [Parastagonospora nodorum SN15]|uniref:Uncharacterized protein n=1 Tax=Phaeosphaeria nodorum (strain SN15 / ATCC MYA-4574 / FGSC 10173) TaxID=321614 RepID=Q0V7B1_PHANO|nr:hypothetical protein SNOG_00103 [Parastagonospora nodorum SN15]EAT91598.1 hypothetical protein SNOG_00103 [Parastagonospora nodorum SN15]
MSLRRPWITLVDGQPLQGRDNFPVEFYTESPSKSI